MRLGPYKLPSVKLTKLYKLKIKVNITKIITKHSIIICVIKGPWF